MCPSSVEFWISANLIWDCLNWFNEIHIHKGWDRLGLIHFEYLDFPFTLFWLKMFNTKRYIAIYFKQTWCSRGYSTITFVIHWFIDSFINWVILESKYLPNTINPNPEELGSWNFERMFFPHYASCLTCHVSCVMCHLSHVKCFLYSLFTYSSNL